METIVHSGRSPASCSAAHEQLVSVVIVNYNYGRYLKQCIESVLAQDYEPMEVIVVDDGSTDDSRALIESYSDRVLTLFKPNGGVISATNHGFELSYGSVVIFVDADDYLLPGAVAAHTRALREPGVVRSQAYMAVQHGNEMSTDTVPGVRSAEGDLRDLVLDRGPGSYVSSPTSGNAWSRDFLEKIFPLPEKFKGVAQDTLLMDAAPLFGKIVTLKDQPWAVYRLHSDNMNGKLAGMTPKNIGNILAQYDARTRWLETVVASVGRKPRASEWRGSNWRMLTLSYLSSRILGTGNGPSIAANLKAVLRTRCNPLKRALLALAILGIRLAPLSLSMYLASKFIKLRFM